MLNSFKYFDQKVTLRRKYVPGVKMFRMYSYVIRMSLVCTCMSIVLMSLLCTRISSYVTHMSLVCNCMPSICHSYVLIYHPYVTPVYFYVIDMSFVCRFINGIHLNYFSHISRECCIHCFQHFRLIFPKKAYLKRALHYPFN